MDYIIRDAARAIIEEQQKSVCYAGRWGRGGAIDVEKYDALEAVLDTIDAIPAADVAPVRHGEWLLKHIGYGHYWECSECHTNPCIYVTENTKFCPNCGARMDGGADDD